MNQATFHKAWPSSTLNYVYHLLCSWLLLQCTIVQKSWIFMCILRINNCWRKKSRCFRVKQILHCHHHNPQKSPNQIFGEKKQLKLIMSLWLMDNISDGDQIPTWKPTFRNCLLSMGLSHVEQTLYPFQGSILCSTLKKKQIMWQFFEQKWENNKNSPILDNRSITRYYIKGPYLISKSVFRFCKAFWIMIVYILQFYWIYLVSVIIEEMQLSSHNSNKTR